MIKTAKITEINEKGIVISYNEKDYTINHPFKNLKDFSASEEIDVRIQKSKCGQEFPIPTIESWNVLGGKTITSEERISEIGEDYFSTRKVNGSPVSKKYPFSTKKKVGEIVEVFYSSSHVMVNNPACGICAKQIVFSVK